MDTHYGGGLVYELRAWKDLWKEIQKSKLTQTEGLFLSQKALQ